jgi:non-ribosomal peptide synthetase component E (peptide arylation enzyme)
LGAVIVDEDLKETASGEAGGLCVTGPQTTPGYWRDPAKTADRLS